MRLASAFDSAVSAIGFMPPPATRKVYRHRPPLTFLWLETPIVGVRELLNRSIAVSSVPKIRRLWDNCEMRIGLRADSSETTGAGHLMRQLTIAEYLVPLGVEVFLLSHINGPHWLEHHVSQQIGLTLIETPEGNFDPELVEPLELDALLIDSYQLSQTELDKLKAIVEVVGVMLDGPHQALSGSIAFAPAFDQEAEWLDEARGKFDQLYSGPEYFLLRREVLSSRVSLPVRGNSDLQKRILISLGGGESEVEADILRALLELEVPVEIDIFFPPGDSLLMDITESNHTVRSHEKGAGFLDLVVGADVTISGAGSVASELFYLGTSSIIVPVARNQYENARSILRQQRGPVIWPDSPDFVKEVTAAVERTINRDHSMPSGRMGVDGLGSMRIAKIMCPGLLPD